MTELWSAGAFAIPVDHLTDCNDMFECVTGDKSLPQDRGHRLYIAAMRELRITGCIRRFLLVPTESMLADCLTKSQVDLRYFAWVAANAKYQLVKDERGGARASATFW